MQEVPQRESKQFSRRNVEREGFMWATGMHEKDFMWISGFYVS